MGKQAKAGQGGLDLGGGTNMGVERYLRYGAPAAVAGDRRLMRGELVLVHEVTKTAHGYHRARVMAADGVWAWMDAEDLAETQEGL